MTSQGFSNLNDTLIVFYKWRKLVRCLFLGVVMMEIADFDLGVSLRNVSDQDMEKAIIKVLD